MKSVSSKSIVYVDMDDVLCNYTKGHKIYSEKYPECEWPQENEGMYLNLEPMEGAIEGFKFLQGHPLLDVYILSTPSYRNPHSYTEKRLWVEKWLGINTTPNLILSGHKHLNKGSYLIDDNVTGNGQDKFSGKLLHFGSNKYPDWDSIKKVFRYGQLKESS